MLFNAIFRFVSKLLWVNTTRAIQNLLLHMTSLGIGKQVPLLLRPRPFSFYFIEFLESRVEFFEDEKVVLINRILFYFKIEFISRDSPKE